MTLVIINPNITKNTKLLYCSLDFAVDYISVFLNSVFTIYFDGFLKEFALKIIINIPLKYIDRNLAIVFITHMNF